MRRTPLILAIALATITAPQAHARTTQEFFDLCGNDEEACGKRIDEVRAAAEKAGAKFCPPSTMDREGYIFEITYWIGETGVDVNQDDAKSITAALKALYSCKPQGSKP